MPTPVLMPALSPTMTEGNLAKWVAKEGDMIESGDVLCEIETDKATMEVEAVDEGKLAKIIVPEGSEGVAVNAVIAVLLEEGEDESALADMAANDAPAAPAPAPEKAEGKSVAPAPVAAPAPAKGGERIFASPLAKRLAAEKGVDLSAVKGSGPHGRIVKADIEGAGAGVAQAAAPQSVSAPLPPMDAEYIDIPNNNIKKVTAKRLQESKQQVPHFYLTVECKIDALMAARKQINDDANGAYKLSVNDFVLKAVAQALKAYPAANVSWGDDAVRQYTHADISVAVSTPNGLITPIVFAAETKGLRQISDEVKDLAGRAREGKLKPQEFQGGTFTVSNLGMYGVKEFDAIINPPQACILAVGAGIQQPVVEKGEIKVATVMNCTLSVDHRAVDGAVGAEFLQIFKRYIENPAAMLV